MPKIINEKITEAKEQIHILVETIKEAGYNDQKIIMHIYSELVSIFNELEEFEKQIKNNLIGYLKKEKVIE